MMPEEVGKEKRLGRKKGSPKSLSPEVRSLIASRAISERDTTREQLAESLIAQIEAQGYTSPTFETTIKYISRARSSGDDSLDKTWSTISLGREMIDGEVIPWLIGAQVHRKQFLSRPLTVREARWFNRLFGLKNSIKLLPEMVSNPKLELFYKSNMLATWSEIYAYREKIDSIAGIKEPDFSDLDAAVLQQNSKSMRDYSGELLRDQMIHINDTLTLKNHHEPSWEELLSPVIEVRFWEMRTIYHSLGEPAMSSKAIGSYLMALKFITPNLFPIPTLPHEREFVGRIQKLDYEKKIKYIISVRQQYLPGFYDIDYEKTLTRLLDEVTKGGE